MPRSFAEVYDLYRQANDQGASLGQQSLADFSKDLNVWTGTNEFDQANTGTLSGLIKKGSYWADKGIQATGLDELAGQGGRAAFDFFGANPEIGYDVGKSTPRMLADLAPLAVAGVLGTASAPLTVPALITAGALGAANAWEKSGSPLQAATGFAMPAVGMGASRVASQASSALLGRLSQYVPGLVEAGLTGGTRTAVEGGTAKIATTLPDKIMDYLAGNVGAVGGIEAMNRTLNGSPGYDLFSKESVLANVVGILPFAAHDITKFYAPRPIQGTFEKTPVAKEAKVEAPVVDANTRLRAQNEIEAINALQKADEIKDPAEQNAAYDEIRSKYTEAFERLRPTKPSETKILGFDKEKLVEAANAPKHPDPLVAGVMDMFNAKIVEKLDKQLPAKIETPEDFENVLVQAGAKNPWVSNRTASADFEKFLKSGETVEGAAKKTAQKINNKEKAQAPQRQLNEEFSIADEEQQIRDKEAADLQKTVEGSKKLAPLLEKVEQTGPEGDVARQVWNSIKKIVGKDSTKLEVNSAQSKSADEIFFHQASTWENWEQARTTPDRPFGKSSRAKPIYGLPLDQQIKILVGALRKVRTTKPNEGKFLSDEAGQPHSFTQKEAEDKVKSLGSDKWQIRKVGNKRADGTYNYRVQEVAAPIVNSVADIETLHEVAKDTANHFEQAYNESLGLDESVGHEVVADAVTENILSKADETLIDAVLNDPELLKLVTKTPGLQKAWEVIQTKAGLTEADEARALIESVLQSRAKFAEARKRLLSRIAETEEIGKQKIVVEQTELQKQALEDAEEAFRDRLTEFAKSKGIELSPKDKNQAANFANKTSKFHLDAVEHFKGLPVKEELLKQFLANPPVEVAALLGGTVSKGEGNSQLYRAKVLQKNKSFHQLSDTERNAIWKDTGWMLAPDGKWRYEINDVPAKANEEVLKSIPQDGETTKFLKDVLSHDELYEKYPILKHIGVAVSEEAPPFGGMFEEAYDTNGNLDPANSFIVLHPKHYDTKGLILHEIQHAIQVIDGFARGSNPSDMALVRALSPGQRQTLKSSLIENSYRDFSNYTEAQWDKQLLSSYGNHLYEATHGEREAQIVAERYKSSKRRQDNLAPFSRYQFDTGYETIIEGPGSSFSIHQTPESRSKFEQHLGLPNFVQAFGRGLESRGMDFETAQVVSGVMQGFLPHLGLDDAKFHGLVNDVKEGREVIGMTAVSGPMKQVWLAVDGAGMKGSPEAMVRDAAIALVHESGHGFEWMDANGYLDAEGQQARRGSEKWFDEASPEERTALLNVMRESMLPKEWHELPKVKELMDYTQDPKESMATAYALWNFGSVANKFDGQLLAAVSPKPVRTWLQHVTDGVKSVVGAIKSAFLVDKSVGSKARREQVDKLVENFDKIKKSMAKGQQDLDKLNRLASVDSEDFKLVKASDIQFTDSRGKFSEGDAALMFRRDDPPVEFGKAVWQKASEAVEYLEQMAARVPAMAEAAWSVLNANGSKHSYMQRVMNPFVGEVDPTTGRPKPDPKRQKMIDLWNKNDNVIQAISDVRRFQNREKRFFGPKQDVKLADQIRNLPADQREAVETYLSAAKVSTRQGQQEILAHNEKNFTVTAAKLLAGFVPEKHGNLLQAADMLMKAEQFRTAGLTNDAVNMLSQVHSLIQHPDAVNKAMDFVKDAQAGLGELAKFFESRPWFASEIQTGKWRVFGTDKSGKKYGPLPANDKDLKVVKQQLKDQGATDFTQQESTRGYHFEMDDGLRGALEATQLRMEAALNRNLNKVGIGPGEVKDMLDNMNLVGNMEQFSKATNPINPHTRLLSKQAEALDMVATHRAYNKMMASVLVNSLTKNRLEFELMNPKTRIPELADKARQVKESLNNYLKPDSEIGKAIVRIQAPYFLGLNLPNHMAEMAQSLFTILPEAVRTTGGVVKASKMLGGVLKDLGNFYIKRPFRSGKEAWDHWGSAEEKRVLEALGEEGLMSRHAYNEGQDDEGTAGTTSRYRATSSSGKNFLMSGAKAYSDFTMGIYENFTRFNARVSSLLGYRMARAEGIPHEQAIDQAKRFMVTTTFASGRTGRPTMMFGGNDNTVGMVALAMQRYSLGWMGMFGRQMQHSFVGDVKAEIMGLKPGEQKVARKAAAVMALTQFGAAGALGLPFVGAMTTILEKMLGQNIKGGVYQLFGEMMDDDEQDGGMLADIFMRGAANAMLDRAGVPVDLASKFALGGTPGFSEMQGFDTGSIFGPTASLVKSLSLGVQTLARDGDVLGFARQAFPPGLRKAVDVFANGDATTPKGEKLGLDDWNQKLYALGFTPDRVRKMRDFERFADANNLKRRQTEARQSADILSLLESDPAGAVEKAQQLVLQSDGSLTLKEVASKVAEAAVKKEFPKDVRSEIARADQGPAAQMLKGMGLKIGESQEAAKQMKRNEVLSFFGVAPRKMQRGFEADLATQDDPWLASFAGAMR